MTHKHRVVFGSTRCPDCGDRLVYRDRPKESEECSNGNHLLPAGDIDGWCINCRVFCYRIPGHIGGYTRFPENLR